MGEVEAVFRFLIYKLQILRGKGQRCGEPAIKITACIERRLGVHHSEDRLNVVYRLLPSTKWQAEVELWTTPHEEPQQMEGDGILSRQDYPR